MQRDFIFSNIMYGLVLSVVLWTANHVGANIYVLAGISFGFAIFVGCSNYLAGRRKFNSIAKQMRNLRYDKIKQIDPGNDAMYAEIASEYHRLHAAYINSQHEKEIAIAQQKTKRWREQQKFNGSLQKAQKQATTDTLTGLNNRAALQTSAEELFGQAKKQNAELTCLMIDIDNFKQVNDNFGHAVGDQVVTFAGRMIQTCMRQGDMCFRYGGDEFVVFLQGCSLGYAAQVAERLRGFFIREVGILLPGEIPAEKKPSLSMGLASLKLQQSPSVADLMDAADRALYKAKENGRNQVIC
ncbi:MAG: GGDEF domain-containing protein [Phycisphaerae bacterium]|nr:GGDEF domain-containing protein [Phycisphaerae bacterium]